MIGGVPISVGWSWAVISVLVGATFWARAVERGASWGWGAAAALLAAVLFMAGVAVHELSHAVAARRRGIEVRRVTLFLFGGTTELALGPGDSRHEAAVALAGPLASLGMAGILWGCHWALGGAWEAGADTLWLLALVNVAVAGFNLLPGLPLDGGRVVRSLLARGWGAERATVLVAGAGRILGVVLVGAGVAGAAWYPAALWNVVVGGFLYRVAGASRPDAPAAALAVAPAGPIPVVAGPDAVAEARTGGGFIPVVDAGRVVGLVLPGGPPGRAGEVMMRLRRSDLVPAGGRVVLFASRPRVVVEDGRMVGVIPGRSVLSPP